MTAYEKDLVILVPDKNALYFVDGVLSQSVALGLREPQRQIDTHPLRDAGCLDADELLVSQADRYAHALVVANRELSGHREIRRIDAETVLEAKLSKAGWGSRARAIVVDPGVGRWMLEHELGERWSPETETPVEKVVETVLLQRRIPQSPALYRTLGERLVREGEPDPAWQKILSTLKAWFSVDHALGGDTALNDPTNEGLLGRLEPLSRAGKLDAALDLVFDHVDGLLLAGRFPEVNRLLDNVPVEVLDSAILIGFLTITGPARRALEARSAFVARVRAQLQERMPPEEMARVMRGLE